MDCPERDRLLGEASCALQLISDLTRKQIEVLYANDPQHLSRLDKQLELAFGEKERAIGALHQHQKEHAC